MATWESTPLRYLAELAKTNSGPSWSAGRSGWAELILISVVSGQRSASTLGVGAPL
jgi:hypothetical protein